jgi:hypothetical protein
MISIGIATRSQAIQITVSILKSPIKFVEFSQTLLPDNSIISTTTQIISVAKVKNKIIKIKVIKILCLSSAILYSRNVKIIAAVLNATKTMAAKTQVI